MKKKKWLLTIPAVVIILVIAAIFIYRAVNDESSLTSEERTWINSNINNIQNVYVYKDENIFSKDGHGLFYTFLDDFTNEYGIKINVVGVNAEENNGISLTSTHYLKDNSKIFLKDHYVLLSKNKQLFNQNSDLEDLDVNILASDLEYIKKYLKDVNINYKEYNTIDELINSLNDSNYLILPRIKYLNTILEKDLQIVYHLSDINNYYVLNGIDDIFSSILNKYYTKWEKNIKPTIKQEEFNLFTKSLNISDTNVDKLLSINYNYAFINNSPYEVIMSGNYGGIVAEYLQEFSEFSNIFFNVTKYKNIPKLVRAINRDKVDIYFDFNENIEDNFSKTNNGVNGTFSIITRKDSDKVINSIYGLIGESVYVEENSNLQKYLESIGNINIITYKDNKELFRLNKKDVIIVIDSYIYDYYANTKLNNYVSKHDDYTNNLYTFKIKSDYKTLNLLLDKYINYLDNKMIIASGIDSHTKTINYGNILNNIAIYFILSISLVFVIGFIVYRNSKRIRIAKRLKKDDKIRFIDELTCLKNRAYLSSFMKTWSNNTIYPQAIIVVDLNRLQEINDKYGVEEGDKQIQAAANALIKTQLDNSELMRSDGNEFVIYTVGYNQKQITNYIHKLNKELKKLPYDFGAEYGYSIILNNLKTIEDALTEATLDMKNKKASVKE